MAKTPGDLSTWAILKDASLISPILLPESWNIAYEYITFLGFTINCKVLPDVAEAMLGRLINEHLVLRWTDSTLQPGIQIQVDAFEVAFARTNLYGTCPK